MGGTPELRVHFYKNPASAGLVFRVYDNLLYLTEENYVKSINFVKNPCFIKIGELNIRNIINVMNIFAEHGRANNKDNPNIEHLLKSNRLMTKKSARKIEN